MTNPQTHLSPALLQLAQALVRQDASSVLIPPLEPRSGFWFGGGNVVQAPDGSLLITGRYRNYGDSRTGTGTGERGLELAIFRASHPLGPWEKILHWPKSALVSKGIDVVSIEGASLLFHPGGEVELFVSTEKDAPYPDPIRDYQKPDTGVWAIDRLAAPSLEALAEASPEPVLAGATPSRLHLKDPTAFLRPDGSTALIFCNHPHTWSSSNSGLALRPPGGEFQIVRFDWLPRGPVWDVAVTRVTDRMPVPALGRFATAEPHSLYFYCGAESLRQLDDNPLGVKRPRGWSCEEIGGVAFGVDSAFPHLERLSLDAPAFVSPHGTGCSRYVSTLVTESGILATWQQSQPDLSQPLVGHFLSRDEIEACLS